MEISGCYLAFLVHVKVEKGLGEYHLGVQTRSSEV